MTNFLAKSLVLVHTAMSIAGMSWAITTFLQDEDFGWREPRKEVLEYDSEGNPKIFVRHASVFDKSQAALLIAKDTRDLTYAYVKPALDQIRDKEAYLANNHFHYKAEMKRLYDAPGEIEVKPLKDGGLTLDVPNLGKPVQDDKALPNIKKSYLAYQSELKDILDQTKMVDDEIQADTLKTKAITARMTGTNDKNEPVAPGLYQLIDMEFEAQSQLKIEIDDIKPRWSKAKENARLYESQRQGLESTLQKLKKPAPQPTPKPGDKKIIS